MTSDIFFITATVCIVILTILIAVLLIKLINSLDDINIVVTKAKDLSSNIARAVGVVASAATIFSPLAGMAKKTFSRKKKK